MGWLNKYADKTLLNLIGDQVREIELLNLRIESLKTLIKLQRDDLMQPIQDQIDRIATMNERIRRKK